MRKITKGRLGDFTFPINPTNLKYGGGVEWIPISSSGMSNPLWQLGNAKPHTISFELYVTKTISAYVDVASCLAYLRKYRGGRQSIMFAYGEHYVNKVVVADLNITGESYDEQLRLVEFRADITLNVVF